MSTVAAKPRARCRHCGELGVNRPRGLCWRCYYSPDVSLEDYQSTSKCARRNPDHLTVAARKVACTPTKALPGSDEKVAVLEERAAKGQWLWHPDDAQGGLTMRHAFTIPGWTPKLLNSVRGRHWSAEHRAKKETKAMLESYAYIQRVPQARGRRRVEVLVTLNPKQGQPDKDAYDKILLDALVRTGLLLDDGEQGLEGRMGVRFERGTQQSTTIILEDVGNE